MACPSFVVSILGVLFLSFGSMAGESADPSIWIGRIRLLAEQGHPEALLKVAEAALARATDDAEVWFYTGWAREKTGDPAGAFQAYQRSHSIDRNWGAARSLAILYGNTNRPDEAVAILAPQLERRPEDPDLRGALGRLYRDDLNIIESTKLLEEGVALAPDRADLWSELLETRLFLGDLAEATGTVQKASKALGDHPIVHYWAGRIALASGEYSVAADRIQRAVIANPGDAMWQMYLGKAMAGAGRFVEARAALETAVTLSPSLAGAYYQLGQVYRRTRDPANARMALLLHQLLRGETEKGWEGIPEGHPAYPYVHQILAAGCLRQGDAAGAVDHASRAFTRGGNLVQMHFTMAEAYVAQEEFRKALDILVPLASQVGADPEYHYLLADVYARIGDPEQSRRETDLAGALGPIDRRRVKDASREE